MSLPCSTPPGMVAVAFRSAVFGEERGGVDSGADAWAGERRARLSSRSVAGLGGESGPRSVRSTCVGVGLSWRVGGRDVPDSKSSGRLEIVDMLAVMTDVLPGAPPV